MLIAPFSAIPSWEGFEYQGHIALYLTIKQIYKMIANKNINDIELYKLLIEGVEDFSIVKNNSFISMHQVKQGAVSLDENDKFCFIISLLQYKAEKGYYHLNSNIKLPTGFVTAALNIIDSILKELYKDVKTKDEFSAIIKGLELQNKTKILSTSSEYKSYESQYVLISKISSNTEKGSHYKLLDYVCNGDKTKSNVTNSISQIITELTSYKTELFEKKDMDYVEEFGEKFSDPNSVIWASCRMIDEILQDIHPLGQMYYDDLYFRFIYNQILLEMKNTISSANTKHDKNHCSIEFKTLYDIIILDHKENSNTKEYQYYELLKLIIDEFGRYPSRNNSLCTCTNCCTCSDINSCNLYLQIRRIRDIDYNDIKDLLHKLLLRTPKNNLPRCTVIRNLFITLIKKIDGLRYFESNVVLAEKFGKFYRLTLDENENIDDFLEQIQQEKSIFDVDKFLIYESDVLITDRLNESEFRYNQIGFNVIGEKEFSDIIEISTDSIERQKINFAKSKIMRIISKDKAEEELCDNV